LDSNTEKGNI